LKGIQKLARGDTTTTRASATKRLAAVALSSAATGEARDLSALGLACGLMVVRRSGGEDESIAALGLEEPALP
jgi:hypothetical protein